MCATRLNPAASACIVNAVSGVIWR
jgi:hypothetical protein